MIQKNAILKFSKLDSKFKKDCENVIKKHNFCIVKNFLDVNKLLLSKKKIFDKFTKFSVKSKLDPSFNSYEHRKIVNKKKINKNVIEIFNPSTDKDIYNLRKSFKKMISLRNLLLGLPVKKNSFVYKNEKYFTSNRIMLYKSGDGFLGSHYDKKAGDYTKQKFGKYFQILANITKKGDDYKSGGGTIYLKNKKVLIDDYLNYGDVLIYNEKLKHGVDKVLSNKKNKKKGRISILVTFYKNYKTSK
tara:strand:- start:1859 stop:2593 length:735 start_codon:yes stop_codon:yes gene_type:complete